MPRRADTPATPAPPTRRRPRAIPASARERIHNDEATDYLVRGKLVARVHWHPSGHPSWLAQWDTQGRMHGLQRYYHEDGSTQYEAHYEHGLQHGPQRQWNSAGELLCETRFEKGTGRDLWWGADARAGVTELREFVDGKLHGVEQWFASPAVLWSERRFYASKLHGIEREWDGRALRRGYPRFYIHDKRVTPERYVRAAISDPTLHPYLPAEDRPTRPVIIPPSGIALLARKHSSRARPAR